MAAAISAVERHDVAEAARQLEAAPRALRGWEWRHVHARLDQSLAVVTGLPNIENAAVCLPGKQIAVPDGRQYRIIDAESGELLAVRPTERRCRRVLAFTTQQGLRMLVDDRSSDAPFLSLADGEGASCGRLRLPLDQDHPDEMDIPLRAAMSRDGRRIACQTVRSALRLQSMYSRLLPAGGSRVFAGTERFFRRSIGALTAHRSSRRWKVPRCSSSTSTLGRG